MKILKETTDPQTLRVIPRSYVDTVDVILTNERTNTPVTLSELTATTNGGYLDITNVFDLKEDNNYSFEVKPVLSSAGIQCIRANNEYLSSPAGAYFPEDMNNVDIEIVYKDWDGLNNSSIAQAPLAAGKVNAFYIEPNQVGLIILDYDTFTFDTFIISTPIPLSGNIKFIGNGADVDCFINGVLVGNHTFTQSTIPAQIHPLLFNSTGDVGVISGITINFIKIGTNEWTFTEGTGATTTSLEGTVTTLNSDVSTEDMWVDKVLGETIYKGKIFCTNQDDYTINNGLYTERGKDNKYVIYE